METRNTKQKELILKEMSKDENMIHPNIQCLTNIIMNTDSSIGQATVYRNINKLVSDGKISKISTDSGYLYDINTKLHGHFICEKCGHIIDLYDNKYQELIDDIENKYHFKVKNSNNVFYGICDSCQDSNNIY